MYINYNVIIFFLTKQAILLSNQSKVNFQVKKIDNFQPHISLSKYYNVKENFFGVAVVICNVPQPMV